MPISIQRRQGQFTVLTIKSILSAVSKTGRSKIRLTTGDPWGQLTKDLLVPVGNETQEGEALLAWLTVSEYPPPSPEVLFTAGDSFQYRLRLKLQFTPFGTMLRCDSLCLLDNLHLA